MSKLEFDSFYKFLVSLGMAIITLAFFILWFWFKEPFDLMIETSKLNKLTPIAQNIINDRQTMLKQSVIIFPRIFIGLLIIGIFLVFVGMISWSKRQKKIDEHQELTNKKLASEIETMSPKQIVKNIEKDIKENGSAENQNAGINVTQSSNSFISKHLLIQQLVGNKVQEALINSFNVYRNKAIGQYEYDLLVQGRHKLQKDYVVEIKYVDTVRGFSWLKKGIQQIQMASMNYSEHTNSIAKSVLFIVTTNQEVYENVLSLIEQFFSQNTKSKLKTIVIVEDNLESMDLQEIQRKIY